VDDFSDVLMDAHALPTCVFDKVECNEVGQIGHKVLTVPAAPGSETVSKKDTKRRPCVRFVEVALGNGGLDEDATPEKQSSAKEVAPKRALINSVFNLAKQG
jgi:hypothetical protein